MNRIIIGAAFAMFIPALAYAGRIGGPLNVDDSLTADEMRTYEVTFEGDVFADVTVRGVGEGDIDCAILDSNGAMVAKDIDTTNTCMMVIMPTKTQKYRVRVINGGKYTVSYHLETN